MSGVKIRARRVLGGGRRERKLAARSTGRTQDGWAAVPRGGMGIGVVIAGEVRRPLGGRWKETGTRT